MGEVSPRAATQRVKMDLVGVDTGGTFTDVVCLRQGTLERLKVPTTRPDPAPGVVNGLRDLPLRPGFELTHGTTVGTNAFLERRGARTALVTTRGFRDLLILGRGQRPDLYALHPVRPEPLVARELCFELDERLAADGQVLRGLSDAECHALAAELARLGVESVAVCLLFSYVNAVHEEQAARILRGHGLRVSASSEVAPEFREYERASTTVLNAYLQPLLEGYFGRLGEHVRERGGRAFWIVHSAGAVVSAGEAAERAVGAVLSGPAAGAQGAFAVARAAGRRRIMTLDMGGTSTDVALCPGEVPYSSLGMLEGLPVRQLMIDLHTVGAGGGSLAWLDEGGALRVGPASAGSDPGPAAYGRGERPTITDAHVVLGHLPEQLAGGAVRLQPERARAAVSGLGLEGTLEEAAWAILDVGTTHMERALRVISVERGWDPRQFTLVPFGGAGPLLACVLAERLSIPEVLVSAHPGVLCALGAVLSPRLREFARTRLGELGGLNLEQDFAALEREARAVLPRARLERWVDLRYRGQGAELTLPARGELAAAFHRAHGRRFGYAREDFAIEVVAVRVRARERRPQLAASPPPEGPPGVGKPAPIWWAGSVSEWRRYDRATLVLGQELPGPAVVDQYDSTTLIPPGWRAGVDAQANLLLRRA